MEIEGSL